MTTETILIQKKTSQFDIGEIVRYYDFKAEVTTDAEIISLIDKNLYEIKIGSLKLKRKVHWLKKKDVNVSSIKSCNISLSLKKIV